MRRRGVARGRNRPLVADDRSFGRTVLTSGNHVRLSVIAALFALAASSQPKAITFRIPQPTLADHRWLSQKGVEPWRYGIAQEWLRKLGELWSTTYDWRRAEARINRFHNFIAEIDGKKLHYILEKGSGNAAVPLVLLHGWPYSFYSFIDVIEPLAHPERFGGDVKDAFDVIVISAPGVGLSEAPDVPENLRAVGRRYDKLLTEVLGYPQYIVHGGDQAPSPRDGWPMTFPRTSWAITSTCSIPTYRTNLRILLPPKWTSRSGCNRCGATSGRTSLRISSAVRPWPRRSPITQWVRPPGCSTSGTGGRTEGFVPSATSTRRSD
ncbi:MAG: epoxide hydrolase 1 [Deltaproteobacteria bacterium]|nr:MAG: epoxide hydrolase 1 [Deltaproteobacteria bacterium]